MKADIDASVVYPHPVDRVWEALTSSEALAAWLMPNDFKPAVGHRFTFRTKPAPGFDGVVRCEVLELDPPAQDGVVVGGRRHRHHGDVHAQAGRAGRDPAADAPDRLPRPRRAADPRILAGGYPRILGRRLPAYLDQLAGSDTGPVPVDCAEGWRAYLGIFRRWRQTPIA